MIDRLKNKCVACGIYDRIKDSNKCESCHGILKHIVENIKKSKK